MSKHPELNLDEKMALINAAYIAKTPIVFGYENDGEIKARVLIIDMVGFNKAGEPYVNGIDSLSEGVRSFSLSKMRTLHPWKTETPINTSVLDDQGQPLQLVVGTETREVTEQHSMMGHPIDPRFFFNRPRD